MVEVDIDDSGLEDPELTLLAGVKVNSIARLLDESALIVRADDSSVDELAEITLAVFEDSESTGVLEDATLADETDSGLELDWTLLDGKGLGEASTNE